MSATALEVDVVRSRSDERAFLRLPYDLYRSDPNWVAPLPWMERRRWSPRHNASLRSRSVRRFLARRGGTVVGRIAAIVDEAFAARWEPGAGAFGFFECRDDPEAAAALLTAAEGALRERGRDRVLGPINLTPHDEVGLLVEGFDSRPTLLSPYNPPYYPELVEAAGYRGVRDYHAFLWRPEQSHGPAVSRLQRAAEQGSGVFGRVRLRPADVRRWDDEVRTLHALYNESFEGVWGFVPVTVEEFAERAAGFRPFFDPDLLIIAEGESRAVGFALLLPDANEALAPLRGRLLPFGWLRLIRGMRRIRGGRFILIGVVPDLAGRGLAPILAAAIAEAARRLRLDPVEISLVAAGNRRMRHVVEAFGCPRVKTFRLYERELGRGSAPMASTAELFPLG
jgi:GNAT superfamily N-acetyltransferase